MESEKSIFIPDLPPWRRNKQSKCPNLLKSLILTVMFITSFNLPQTLFLTPIIQAYHQPAVGNLFFLPTCTRAWKGTVHTMPCFCLSMKAQRWCNKVCDLPSFLPFTLCWNSCFTWTFQRGKWSVGTATSMVSFWLSLFQSPAHMPKTI